MGSPVAPDCGPRRVSPLMAFRDLEEEIQRTVFSFVGKEHRSTLVLVCKGWSQLAYSMPDLWNPYVIEGPSNTVGATEAAQRAVAQRGRLGRVASLVHTAAVLDPQGRIPASGAEGSDGQLLSPLLRELHPGVLRCLELSRGGSGLPAAAIQALAELSGLTSLRLGAATLPPDAMPAALAALPKLRSLGCEGGATAVQRELARAFCLPQLGAQLTELRVGLELERMYAPLAAMLSRLTRLRVLSLQVGDAPRDLVPSLAALASLEELRLACPAPAGLNRLTRLARLRTITLRCSRGHFPAPADFPAPLESYDLEAGSGLMIGQVKLLECCASGGGMNLNVRPSPGAWPLGQLLPALVPRGRLPRSLLLRQCPLEMGTFEYAVAAAGVLGGLASLCLRSCTSRDMVAVLSALLGMAPALEEPELNQCRLDLSAVDLQAVPCLRELRLLDCRLLVLPAGTYLSGLQELELYGNVLACVPPALSAATTLHTLRIDCNRHLSAIADFDEAGVLRHLPRLRRLSLRHNFFTCLPCGGCLPGLEDLDFRLNSLERLPPGLAAATGLTCLLLDENPDLKITKGEAEAILGRLPRLCRLGLSSTPADRYPIEEWRVCNTAPC